MRPSTPIAVLATLALALGCGARTGLVIPPPVPEECGNGLDDDRDGLVDEACPCSDGAIQVCYGGPDGTEGVGICVAGAQRCTVGEWNDCEGEVLPVAEACVGGLDDDCDGHVDCDDPDCASEPACVPDDCTPHCPVEECDGRDNNGDGRIDEGRICDGIEGPCPAVGAIRICDAYCGVHQRCRRDGSWGPCTADGQGPVPECDEHSDCPRYTWCDYGTCVGASACDRDMDCAIFGLSDCIQDQGVCVGECYEHSDCPRPEVCDLGGCVVDPYAP